MRLALVPLLLMAACRPATPPVTADGNPPPATREALTAATVRSPDGAVALDTFVERLMDTDMICVGEQHDDAGHHRIQHALLEQLLARPGRTLALGLEMVQRPSQSALDDYLRGDLDEARLAEVLEWRERWGFDFAMYEPLFHTAHEHGVRLLALNAPKELTRAVARMGLDHLPPDVRSSLPELDVHDEGHRRFFWAVMGFGDAPSDMHQGDPHTSPHHDPHHSDPHTKPHHDPQASPHHDPQAPKNPHHDAPHQGMGNAAERYYTAQVIWDETMAESAAAWLSDETRQIMVIAGNGHCHQSAIPSRVKRRKPEATTLSILLQTDDVPLPPHTTYDFVIQLAAPQEVEGDDAPAMARHAEGST